MSILMFPRLDLIHTNGKFGGIRLNMRCDVYIGEDKTKNKKETDLI